MEYKESFPEQVAFGGKHKGWRGEMSVRVGVKAGNEK